MVKESEMWIVNFAMKVNVKIDYEVNWLLTIHKKNALFV